MTKTTTLVKPMEPLAPGGMDVLRGLPSFAISGGSFPVIGMAVSGGRKIRCYRETLALVWVFYWCGRCSLIIHRNS